MRVYIAGKLNASSAVDYIKNVAVMVKVYNALLRAGYYPYCPAFDLIAGIVDGGFEYDDYALANKAWLEVSEVVVVLPNWGDSKGTKAEIKRAKQLKIPVIMLLEHQCNMEGIKSCWNSALKKLKTKKGSGSEIV